MSCSRSTSSRSPSSLRPSWPTARQCCGQRSSVWKSLPSLCSLEESLSKANELGKRGRVSVKSSNAVHGKHSELVQTASLNISRFRVTGHTFMATGKLALSNHIIQVKNRNKLISAEWLLLAIDCKKIYVNIQKLQAVQRTVPIFTGSRVLSNQSSCKYSVPGRTSVWIYAAFRWCRVSPYNTPLL